MMKTIRYGAWTLVAIVAAVLLYLWYSGDGARSVMQLAGAEIGGPFILQRADGSTITDKDMTGRPHAIFFGFANCPEVCPTTLFEASGWLEKLGADAGRFSVYFITIDPERDTPQMLSQYMTSFPGIIGITGSPEAIEAVEKLYRVYSKKIPLEGGGYTMDHTATVYLMDESGNFAGTIAYGENPVMAMEKIRRLIARSGPPKTG
jgi:protein SCO1/2